MGAGELERADAVLRAWPVGPASLQPLSGGLINDSFAVTPDEGGAGFVLQRVHPVFAPQVHDNIAAVTARLQQRGVATPVLIPTRDGARWHVDDDGRVWRLMTRMPGVSFARIQSSAQAVAAAALLARFHVALAELPHRFVGMRTGVHDTGAHLQALRDALAEHRDHRLYDAVAPLAAAIEAGAAALPPLSGLPEPVVHGDPKFSNVMFAAATGEGATRATCLVDLDTVGPMALHLELGDMWRSWCNRAGEDRREAAFDLDVFEASLHGYAGARAAPSAAECEALVHGVEWITLELAARFAADALRERYFGWDATAFVARGEHNLVRAAGQWSLHEQVLASRSRRAAAIAAAPWRPRS